MTFRDGADRTKRERRSASDEARRRQQRGQRPSNTWDVDPADIDRYLSGRPTRAEETASQLRNLQRAVTPSTDDDVVLQEGQSVRVTARDEQSDLTYRYDDDPYADLVGSEDEYAPAYEDDVDSVTHVDEDYVEQEQPRREVATRRRTPTRTNSSSRRTQANYEDEYPVDQDDEFYNDDPYLGYEDDEVERASRPRVRRQQSGSTQPARPSVPRINLPEGMTTAPASRDVPWLAMLGVALLSLLVMIFLVYSRLSDLEPAIFTHVSASGDPEQIEARSALWRIPLIAGMVSLMNMIFGWFLSRWGLFLPRLLMGGALLTQFVAWIAIIKYFW